MLDEITRVINGVLAENENRGSPVLRLDSFFDTPVIRVASADDPLFETFKKDSIVGIEHKSPAEWLEGAASVISIFFPFSEKVRRSNYGYGVASVEWAYARVEGQECIKACLNSLCEYLVSKGFSAVDPCSDPSFSINGFSPNWSERHAAFAAGHGTFGLSKSFITSCGKAGRFGTVITSASLKPDRRDYSDHMEYCTRCLQCIPRCPAGAITEQGKDTQKCRDYVFSVSRVVHAPRYGCGKCQTKVACESRKPVFHRSG